MSDRIALSGLAATGYHGVLGVERSAGQRFVVDVGIEADLRQAGTTDDLRDTIDYAKVAVRVVERIQGEAYHLIEHLAEVIAADLLSDGRVDAVEVTVHKPQAPIGVPFGDLAVHIRRERGVAVVIGFGANLGDRAATLAAAIAELGRLAGLTVIAVSALVETDPVGGPAQPTYLNGILLATTAIAPEQLLVTLHAVEDRHGRERNERWGARALDLDLIQYGMPGTAGERRSRDPDLLLPHPRAAQRAFVLEPWAQVDPDAVLRLGPSPADPVRRVVDVLAGLDRRGVRPGPAGWSPW
ncbi:MAG: 2-amino-4-hydroxy-6-hydroxymethyldihydropteridine diphosphokinase [Dermatophilaceae bacterium]